MILLKKTAIFCIDPKTKVGLSLARSWLWLSSSSERESWCSTRASAAALASGTSVRQRIWARKRRRKRKRKRGRGGGRGGGGDQGSRAASERRRDARTRRSIDPRLGGFGVNLISWSSLSLNDQQLLFLESTIFDRHYFRKALSWINLWLCLRVKQGYELFTIAVHE